jgi:hypothetical protein
MLVVSQMILYILDTTGEEWLIILSIPLKIVEVLLTSQNREPWTVITTNFPNK